MTQMTQSIKEEQSNKVPEITYLRKGGLILEKRASQYKSK